MLLINRSEMRYANFFVARKNVLDEGRRLIAHESNEDFKYVLAHYVKCYAARPERATEFLDHLIESKYSNTDTDRLIHELKNEIQLMSKNFGRFSNSYFNKAIDAIIFTACVTPFLLFILFKSAPKPSVALLFICVIPTLCTLRELKKKPDEHDFEYIETPAELMNLVPLEDTQRDEPRWALSLNN